MAVWCRRPHSYKKKSSLRVSKIHETAQSLASNQLLSALLDENAHILKRWRTSPQLGISCRYALALALKPYVICSLTLCELNLRAMSSHQASVYPKTIAKTNNVRCVLMRGAEWVSIIIIHLVSSLSLFWLSEEKCTGGHSYTCLVQPSRNSS